MSQPKVGEEWHNKSRSPGNKCVVTTLLTIPGGIEDGSDERPRVMVIGTTNRPNAIDPALRRPGRLDREIEIGIPDIDTRCSILQSHPVHMATSGQT
ncbi:hypothetical protein C8J57DRAFT_1538264 [Mycena rebaudengoi]|nr:hypothetical protein C8J57DRAFT_1538264 [Mycena rebaudengoi]